MSTYKSFELFSGSESAYQSLNCLLCLHVCLLLYGLSGDGDQCMAAVIACGVSVCGSRAVLGEGIAEDKDTCTIVPLAAWHK